MLGELERVADMDRPATEHLGTQTTTMHKRPQERFLRHIFQVAARLAETRSLAEHLSEPECPPHEVVEAHSARSDVATQLTRFD